MTPESPAPIDRKEPHGLTGKDGRRLWFRLLALAIPLILVVLTEIALRMGDYGYPTSFFLERQEEGGVVLIENPKFGWRFFPAEVARAPQALRFKAQKPLGTIRIFVFGESAAMGDPDPSYGLGRQLQRLLQARHPGQHFEVINVAMTAINSHVIREIAADCASRHGDLWLVYAGNNEVIGPFGAGTVFGARAPNLASVRLILAAKKLRIGQLLSGLGGARHDPKEWQGMELFLRNLVPESDGRLATVYNNFTENLGAILELGKKSGAKVLLSTIAVNLKDNPPFASVHRARLAPGEVKTWEEHFERGRNAESEQRFGAALEEYEKCAQQDGAFAELIFRRAQCELHLGQTNSAMNNFSLARDLDALRFRTDSRLNEIIRKAVNPGVALVDVERELSRGIPDGIPGESEFYDHVHFSFSGNYQVARLLAEQAEKELFPNANLGGSWLPETEVAHQLAFTEFDRHRIGEEMRARLEQPPFSNQSNFADRDKQWQRVLLVPQSAPSDLTWEYRAALAMTPGDWVLRGNFGRLLEETGDKPGAMEQWSQVVEQLPDEPEGYFHIGNLAFDAGQNEQAVEKFKQALRLRPGSLEALSGLGLVLASQGKTNEALAQFDRALKLNERYSAARVNRAVLLAKSGNLPGAISEYETVLQQDTNNVAARINLAKLEFGQGKTNEALALYSRAIELKPDNAVGQFDFGNALSVLGRHEEALQHYAAAVQYHPTFADAQYNLALEQSRFGRIAEALPHFSEAARLSPGAAEVHFNYGVALAKTQRFGEAARQFQETLKLQPNYPGAQSMLSRAEQLASGPLLP